MKGIVKLAIAATLVASAAADSHQHHHRHQHAKRHAHGHQVEKREAYTSVCEGPVETAYVYADGEKVDNVEAKKCLDDGECLVVGSSTPTYTPAPPPSSSYTTSATPPANFYESKPEAPKYKAKPEPKPEPEQKPKAKPAPKPAPKPAAYPTGGEGMDKPFPNGKIPCSEFPSGYGAVPLKYLGLNGYSGIQQTGGYHPGVAISNIVSLVSGQKDYKNSFCSYACPPGYYKAQWPVSSQGATGQSIGGLYCNKDGFLELTHPEFKTLCMKGAGGITIRNELPARSCICMTDYPGLEKMSIPFCTEPGEEKTLTNIDASKAYKWQGKYTSGQFYVNPLGVGVEDACVWDSPSHPKSAGNWAALNIGAGRDIHGITYLSLFANEPTTTAVLDYDVHIEGDVSSECWQKAGGKYFGGKKGCTTAISGNGHATIVLKKSS